jgi:hypothetical protein
VLESLKGLKEQRIRQVAQFALEIAHCWDLLRVDADARREFIASHASLSQESIDSFRAEIQRLEVLIHADLPNLIVSVKTEIRAICDALHRTLPETQQVLEFDDDDANKVFRALDAELIKLKQRLVACQPILELIQKCNEIRAEFKEVSADPTADSQRFEEARSRHAKLLPRIEQKLKLRLREFAELNGEDFIWDGVVLEKRLSQPKRKKRVSKK